MKTPLLSSWIKQVKLFLNNNRFPAKIVFLITGILSTIWILIRVIPKPQRAAYPCVKASAPWASAFIIYLMGLGGSVLSYKKFRQAISKSKYALAVVLFGTGITFTIISLSSNPSQITAAELGLPALRANEYIGEAKGIYPGRVVWVHDSSATNENCTNTDGDYWFQNTDQSVVEGMLNGAIKSIAGETDPYLAWNEIFKYFNNTHGKGLKGYTKGEKIFIKINLTTSCCGGWNNNTEKTSWLEHMDATPQLCLALLKQLVDIVGVAEEDIYMGDPYRIFHDVYWDMLHTEYPDIHYVDGNGYNGREQTAITSSDLLKFSDGLHSSRLPQAYVDATYLINMPCLKTHNEGGITLAAKNHQGSYIQPEEEGGYADGQSAMNMHYSLPANNQGHGKYRHLVDYMGHEHLGGKTLIYIIDGIWAGFNWEGIVEKWQMAPFNNDYPSSLFVSLDPVAIESVCYDFLLEEYSTKDANDQYPYIDGTDDYLLQAADESNWASGIVYDPEGDGIPLESLGVHEHWNNATDKQYSRNLDTGDGIELFSAESDYDFSFVGIDETSHQIGFNIVPQPANDYLQLIFDNDQTGHTNYAIYSIIGQVLRTGKLNDQSQIPISDLNPGTYVIKISTENNEFTARQFIVE